MPGAQTRTGATPKRERQPMRLSQAWNLAKEQEDAGSNPSSDDGTFDLKTAFNMARAEMDGVTLGSPSPAPRPQRLKTAESQTTDPDRDELGQRLSQFDRNHRLGHGESPLKGAFPRNRPGSKVTETTNIIAEKADGGTPALRRGHHRAMTPSKQSTGSLLSEEDTDRFSPLPSIEFVVGPPRRPTPGTRPFVNPLPAEPSPEKSFGWELDADFTAGDLQVSNSPRIKPAKANDDTRGQGTPAERGFPFPSDSGAPGENGIPLERGAPGETGVPGERGAPGERGPPGERGAPGDRGAPSEKGAPGERGFPGDDGSHGQQDSPVQRASPNQRRSPIQTGSPTQRGSPGQKSSPGSGTRRNNARLEQIRQQELAAAQAEIPEDDDSLFKKTNRRLDDIRAREAEAVSKRARAEGLLDEIRARNSESRSRSPEVAPEMHKEALSNGSPDESLTPRGDPRKIDKGKAPAHFLDNKAPLNRRPSNSSRNHYGAADEAQNMDGKTNSRTDKPPAPSRDDSYDLLRQLARATSSSPSPSPPPVTARPPAKDASKDAGAQIPKPPQRPETESNQTTGLHEHSPSKDSGVKGLGQRLAFGFAGLRKNLLGDSHPDKKGNMATSESDPVNRIEAEMDLFAPQDKNFSDKSSNRAHSPESLAQPNTTDEETPRANKVAEPVSQPTPRVTGAYVDTPATTKVKKENTAEPKANAFEGTGFKASRLLFGFGGRGSGEVASKSKVESTQDTSTKEPASLAKTKKPQDIHIEQQRPEENRIKQEDSSDASSKSARASARPSSAPHMRRARSRSKRRRPLRNTAAIPTVKDDLRGILDQNRFDDSTLEDFDDLLTDTNVDPEELEKIVNDSVLKAEEELKMDGLSERERELEFYDRMNKNLQTGLQGIRSAKQGIARLEDQVAHVEPKRPGAQLFGDWGAPQPLGGAMSTWSDGGLRLPMPVLYRRQPRFKLTFYGVLLLLTMVWYSLESAFCFVYGPPEECTASHPCEWSPHQPYYPYVMPYMLDEWTTGGKGRVVAWRVGEEVGDFLAELVDWVTDHDFTEDDEMFMDVWQRRRHRRRLRKHDRISKWIEPPEYREKFKKWRAAFRARERAWENGEEWSEDFMSSDHGY